MDRNNLFNFLQGRVCRGSLSARRAWIEMPWLMPHWLPCWVALRKESVDRNVPITTSDVCGMTSLSARRAWIEIICMGCGCNCDGVALRKESVDRNVLRDPGAIIGGQSLSARRAWIEIPPVDTSSVNVSGRSPQGERG